METLRAKRESTVKSARVREAADRKAWNRKYPAEWSAIIDVDRHERLVKMFADPGRPEVAEPFIDPGAALAGGLHKVHDGCAARAGGDQSGGAIFTREDYGECPEMCIHAMNSQSTGKW